MLNYNIANHPIVNRHLIILISGLLSIVNIDSSLNSHCIRAYPLLEHLTNVQRN